MKVSYESKCEIGTCKANVEMNDVKDIICIKLDIEDNEKIKLFWVDFDGEQRGFIYRWWNCLQNYNKFSLFHLYGRPEVPLYI